MGGGGGVGTWSDMKGGGVLVPWSDGGEGRVGACLIGGDSRHLPPLRSPTPHLSGRYASYWNAFLWIKLLVVSGTQSIFCFELNGIYIPTIAFDVSFKKLIEWSPVFEFIQHPRIMVVRHTGILRISNDVNDLWKVILTSSEYSTEEIKIQLQNRVAIPKASVQSVRFDYR